MVEEVGEGRITGADSAGQWPSVPGRATNVLFTQSFPGSPRKKNSKIFHLYSETYHFYQADTHVPLG
jgi:hypothetical protein